MKFVRMRLGIVIGLATLSAGVLAACSPADSAATGTGASADGFPKSNITVIVPFAAGGPSDITARAIARGMEESLGVTLIVENRPGASGIIGLSEAAAAKADGYTMTYSTGDSFSQSVLRATPYTWDSFTPVSGVVTQPYILVTSKSSGIGDAEDLKSLSGVTYAVTSIGASTHLDVAQLFDGLGVSATAVPFDGAAPAVQAVVGDQVDVMLVDASAAMPFIKSGHVVPLAVLSPVSERLDYLPEVPTLEEAGISTDEMTLTLNGLAVPSGVSDEIVAVLRDALRESVSGKDFLKFAEDNYLVVLNEGDGDDWYANIRDNAAISKKALDKFDITLQ
jgi:tripartite-type tricarboxylate transporter receptor subunit TctC